MELLIELQKILEKKYQWSCHFFGDRMYLCLEDTIIGLISYEEDWKYERLGFLNGNNILTLNVSRKTYILFNISSPEQAAEWVYNTISNRDSTSDIERLLSKVDSPRYLGKLSALDRVEGYETITQQGGCFCVKLLDILIPKLVFSTCLAIHVTQDSNGNPRYEYKTCREIVHDQYQLDNLNLPIIDGDATKTEYCQFSIAKEFSLDGLPGIIKYAKLNALLNLPDTYSDNKDLLREANRMLEGYE